jgi:2,3-bisphosphoglycerate-dependent phosphoglycerate mutase
MPSLVIVRHGQSVWNLENRFTGEADVELTPLGRAEARSAGKRLKGVSFSHAFTSVLKRAEETLTLILEETGHPDLPISRDKALNERNYGALQGLNKTEVARQYGDAQVAIWRRSYSVRPPCGESLADTAARVVPYYKTAIEPLLTDGQNVLIVAHGNSLRALVMHLEHMDPETIAQVDIPTGTPRLYTLDKDLALEGVEYI